MSRPLRVRRWAHLESAREIGRTTGGAPYFEVVIVHVAIAQRAEDTSVIDLEVIIIPRGIKDTEDEDQAQSEDYTPVNPAWFLNRLGQAADREVKAMVVGNLHFSPGEYDEVFPLPIDVQSIPGFQFNEIRGVLLASTRPGEEESANEAFLTKDSDGDLFVTVVARSSERISASLPSVAVGHALRVASYVVNRGQVEAERKEDGDKH